MLLCFWDDENYVDNYQELRTKYEPAFPKCIGALEGLDSCAVSRFMLVFEAANAELQSRFTLPEADLYRQSISTVYREFDTVVSRKLRLNGIDQNIIENSPGIFLNALDKFVQGRKIEKYVHARLENVISQMENQIERFDVVLGPIIFDQIAIGIIQFSLICRVLMPIRNIYNVPWIGSRILL